MGRMEPYVTDVDVARLDDSVRNPNKMTPERFALLKATIAQRGSLQPILVTPRGDRFRIVDGHHRKRAHVELGIATMKAVVAELTDAEVDALQLGMNRNRGEIDLSVAGTIIAELAALGWNSDALQVTGFTSAEIDAMTSVAVEPTLEDANGVVEEQAPVDLPDKPFVLEVAFADKDKLRLVKRKLKKAAGKGGDLGTGLLHVLGEV